MPHKARVNAGNDRLISDVARDHCAGADKCASSDGYAAHDHGAAPDRRATFDQNRHHHPILWTGALSRDSRPRLVVINEHHAMTDEDLILNSDPGANETVGGNLALRSDPDLTPNLDEGSNCAVAADRTS